MNISFQHILKNNLSCHFLPTALLVLSNYKVRALLLRESWLLQQKCFCPPEYTRGLVHYCDVNTIVACVLMAVQGLPSCIMLYPASIRSPITTVIRERFGFKTGKPETHLDRMCPSSLQKRPTLPRCPQCPFLRLLQRSKTLKRVALETLKPHKSDPPHLPVPVSVS